MARLLGVVPWVVEQDGAHLDDISTHFDYPRDQLMEDLEQRLFFVGVHPFTPDTLIEVRIENGIVDIQYADWFSKPMQLSPEEATRLLAAGRTVLDMAQARGPGGGGDEDEANPLVRALAKLTLSLGSEDATVDYIDVCLGSAPSETLDDLRRAISRRRQIELEYYSQGRDVMTTRTVDPARLLSHDGVWYLFGWCHRAEAERVFRVDRIRSLTVMDSVIQVDLPAGSPPSLSVDSVTRTVTIRLAPEAAWAADYYSARQRTEGPDGSVDAVFAVASESWLARLLVQLGPQADLIVGDGAIDADLRAATAERMLERYRR
jgi:proteasome accessory factor C